MQLPTTELAQCRWTLQHQTVQAKPPEETKKFTIFPLLPRRVRRTVKSSTSIVAVVAGSLHSNEKSLSAGLRRYQGFGVHVTFLHLGFDVTDFNSLPLITNDLME